MWENALTLSDGATLQIPPFPYLADSGYQDIN